MNRFHRPTKWLAGLLISAAATTAAVAGDRERAGGDIEQLDARLIGPTASPRLILGFRVTIDDARPGERFELVTQLGDDDRLLLDDQGRPLTAVIPLDQPVERDGDEITFEGQVELDAPEFAARVDDLELHAIVTHAGDEHALDEEETDVEIDCERPRGEFLQREAYYEQTTYEPTRIIEPAPVTIVQRAPAVIVRPAPVIVARPAPTIVVRRAAPTIVVRPAPRIAVVRRPTTIVNVHRPAIRVVEPARRGVHVSVRGRR